MSRELAEQLVQADLVADCCSYLRCLYVIICKHALIVLYAAILLYALQFVLRLGVIVIMVNGVLTARNAVHNCDAAGYALKVFLAPILYFRPHPLLFVSNRCYLVKWFCSELLL